MPARMLRDWTASEIVNQIDWKDEVFFVRLIMKADDFGRFTANAKLLRSLLFPLKDGLRDTDITRSLAACQKAGLIRLYSFEEKPLLEIVNFNQRLQQKTSKYPGPDDSSASPLNTVNHRESPSEEKRSRREVELEGRGKARASCCDEIITYCLSVGLLGSDGIFLWEKWEANGWLNGGQKIKDWKGTVRAWKAGGFFPSQKNPNGHSIQKITPLPGPAEYEPKKVEA